MKSTNGSETTKKLSSTGAKDYRLTLGEIYPSDFLKPGQQPASGKFPLELVLDRDLGTMRLAEQPKYDTMFGKYWYRSGTNESMRAALKDVVDHTAPMAHRGGRWLDIACNDGTLLSYVPHTWKRFGVDPCEDRIFNEAKKHGLVLQDYFSAELLYRARIFPPKFDVITTIAMFYDLMDPDQFCKDVYEVLEDEGLWVLQLSYTPLMIRQLAFDNICHEHAYYHTLSSMTNVLKRNGFRVMDCTLNDVNGGSMRLFVRKISANPNHFGSRPYRDVCHFRMTSLLTEEAFFMLDEVKTWRRFFENVAGLRETVLSFIVQARSYGKTVMAYGASTKGNTLLQYFGLDNTMIDAVAEKQECKWGLRTVGSNIPIISEEEMRRRKPDYLLVLPWHFISEFFTREKEWHDGGGRWICPCPKFEII